MGLFGIGTKRVSGGTVNEVYAMVETSFRKQKMDAGGQQLESEDGFGWWFKDGSAIVYIFLLEGEEGPMIKVTSPIVHFPAFNREQFLHKLLEINRDLNHCSLASFQEVVLVTTQRPTYGLDQEELDHMIWTVGHIANKLDDQLSREFHARLYQDNF